jgi:hypothetical protein
MSDPRRPAMEADVTLRASSDPMDYFGLVATVLGMFAMLFKVKELAYLAVLLQFSSFACKRFNDRDLKTLMFTLSISVMAIMSGTQQLQTPPPQPAPTPVSGM